MIKQIDRVIGDLEAPREPSLGEVGPGEGDSRFREIDAAHLGAASRKPHEVHAGAAADFEHRTAGPAVEVHEPQQMVKLLEMVLIEVVEKATRADRMLRDLEIVNMPFPVFTHLLDADHR